MRLIVVCGGHVVYYNNNGSMLWDYRYDCDEYETPCVNYPLCNGCPSYQATSNPSHQPNVFAQMDPEEQQIVLAMMEGINVV